jgi:nicotinamide-nucleotide amidase
MSLSEGARVKAATLAIGTEITDGQITDRNSTWISDRCTAAGLDVVEHRAVPDDRSMIAQALRELSEKSDYLFVTGGLGPTSDDMTRDLVADVFQSPLEYDEASWQKIEKRFAARGALAKPIQQQQCFFPKGSTLLENPAGTANAFSLSVVWNKRPLFVVVLPGPPAEIAAIWDLRLAQRLESVVPMEAREDLVVWQTLGLGEGDIAEKVEAAVAGSGLRIGYRVHLPFVEVKLWARSADANKAKPFIDRINDSLATWTVGRGKSDSADCLIRSSFGGRDIVILDLITGGYLQSRLMERLAAFRKSNPGLESKGSLRVTTLLLANELSKAEQAAAEKESDSIFLSLVPDDANKGWVVKLSGSLTQTLAVEPTPLYNFGTERGHKYMAEKMFHALSGLALFV